MAEHDLRTLGEKDRAAESESSSSRRLRRSDQLDDHLVRGPEFQTAREWRRRREQMVFDECARACVTEGESEEDTG